VIGSVRHTHPIFRVFVFELFHKNNFIVKTASIVYCVLKKIILYHDTRLSVVHVLCDSFDTQHIAQGVGNAKNYFSEAEVYFD